MKVLILNCRDCKTPFDVGQLTEGQDALLCLDCNDCYEFQHGLNYNLIYEDDETGNALYDYCTNCQRPVKQEDLGKGIYGCEFCKETNHIEIRKVRR